MNAIFPKMILRSPQPQHPDGFTLLELLVVMAMIGILTAIAVPSWLSFTYNQRLNAAQSSIYSALRLAQSNAKRDKVTYQVSFRYFPGDANNPPGVQSAIHKQSETDNTKVFWEYIDPNKGSVIDMRGVSPSYVTNGADLAQTTFGTDTIRRIQFDAKGYLSGTLLNRYIALRTNPATKRRACITGTTLLGAIRTLSEGESSCPIDPN